MRYAIYTSTNTAGEMAFPEFVIPLFSRHCVGYIDFHDSKLHGANMGPIWGRQDPGGLHVGLMNFFAIWVHTLIRWILIWIAQSIFNYVAWSMTSSSNSLRKTTLISKSSLYLPMNYHVCVLRYFLVYRRQSLYLYNVQNCPYLFEAEAKWTPFWRHFNCICLCIECKYIDFDYIFAAVYVQWSN